MVEMHHEDKADGPLYVYTKRNKLAYTSIETEFGCVSPHQLVNRKESFVFYDNYIIPQLRR